MTVLGLILALAIVGVVAWRTRRIMRSEAAQRLGSRLDTGRVVLRSEYASGGGGGGHFREYSVPGDPQEYARLFVPKVKETRR